MRGKRNRSIQWGLGILVLFMAVQAGAASYSWDGSSSEFWDFASNWSPVGPPGSGDSVHFNFPTAQTEIELNGDQEVLNLNFVNSGFNFRIIETSLGDTLTLGSGDLTVGSITTSSPRSHELQNVTLGANGIWDIGTAPSFPLIMPHQLEVFGTLTGPRLEKQGGGTLLLTGGTSSAPSTLATLKVRGGEVVIDGATLDLTSTDFSASTGAMNTENGGDITITNGATVRLATGDSSTAVIDDATLTVTGSGTLLSGRDLRVAEQSGDAGSVIVESNASVDMTSDMVIGFDGDGSLIVQTGGTVSCADIGAGATASGTIRITDNGSSLTASLFYMGGWLVSDQGGTGELVIESGGSAQGTAFFWSSTSSITVDGGTLESSQLMERPGIYGLISLSDPAGGSAALTVGANNQSSTFNGVIENVAGGTGSLKKIGTGTLTLNGTNTYTGGTTIEAGTLSVGNGGTSGSIAGNVANNGALIFNRSNNLIFGGDVSGSGSLTQNGSDNLVLTGTSTYTGGTTISNGKLKIGSNGGTTGSILGNVTNHSVLVFQRSNDVVFGGIISGSGILNKNSDGVLTFTGANSYSGTTTINNGTLLANNTTGSATGSGAVNVTSGATLGGTGIVSGSVTMESTATIAPGASVGTLILSSNLTLSGTYPCEIDGAFADQLAVGGILDISSGTLDIDLLSGGTTEAVYVIATYGSLTGSSFASVIGLPAGYEINYAYNGNQIALVQTSSFEYWADAHDLSGINAWFDADPDGDGGMNGYEWATGTHPTNGSSIALLEIGSTNSDAIVSFTRNTNATDVVILLQRSLDLMTHVWSGVATNTAGNWSPPGIVTETGVGNPVNVEVVDPQTNHPAANYRLRVE